jgi:hypothetical protein
MLAARPEHIGSVASGCCGAALRRVTSAIDTTADETSRREIRPVDTGFLLGCALARLEH